MLGCRSEAGRVTKGSLLDRFSATIWLIMSRQRWRPTNEDREAIIAVRDSVDCRFDGGTKLEHLASFAEQVRRILRARLHRLVQGFLWVGLRMYLSVVARPSETGLVARRPSPDREEAIQRLYRAFRSE